MRNGHPIPGSLQFDPGAEQVMLQDAARRFVREHYAFEERRRLAASPAGFSQAHWASFAGMGWLGLNLPEDVGGLGCSFVDTVLLMEQFGRGMVLEPYLSCVILGATVVEASGSPVHRHALLPAVAQGTLLLALAHDESGRPSTALPATRAVASVDGFELSGSKMLVLGGSSAGRVVVSVQLDGELALFVIDPDRAGVSRTSYAMVCGNRAADLHLKQVRCPRDELLARGAAARAALDLALDRARLAAMAQALGVMEVCQETAAEYLKGRTQFGQPLAKFQSLQHSVAEMFVDTQESRSILYHALSCIDADPDRRGRAVSAAKLVVGESGRRVSAKGVQLLGGYGTVDEYATSWHFRLLYVLDQLFGDSNWHAARLAAGSPLLA